jgi:hypothetical protein
MLKMTKSGAVILELMYLSKLSSGSLDEAGDP